MELTELAEAYGEDAIDRVVISNLYRQMDCTEINSNAYEITHESGGEESRTMVTFDKFGVVTAPLLSGDSPAEHALISEGEEPPHGRVYDIGETFARTVYDEFCSHASHATYPDASYRGIRKALDDYENYVNRTPTTVVIDDDLIDGETISAIEETADVSIHESEYLDLGDEMLVSNDQVGYDATRTEVDSVEYQDVQVGMDAPLTRENPQHVTVFTRRGIATVKPGLAVRFTLFE